MSSICVASLPIKNGRRYSSTAVATKRARWVNVAQPSPYNPGSLVVTLTTTSRIPAGAVKIAFTSVIFSGPPRGGTGISPVLVFGDTVPGCCDWANWLAANSGSAAPPAKEICVSHLRRSIINPLLRQDVEPRINTNQHG